MKSICRIIMALCVVTNTLLAVERVEPAAPVATTPITSVSKPSVIEADYSSEPLTLEITGLHSAVKTLRQAAKVATLVLGGFFLYGLDQLAKAQIVSKTEYGRLTYYYGGGASQEKAIANAIAQGYGYTTELQGEFDWDTFRKKPLDEAITNRSNRSLTYVKWEVFFAVSWALLTMVDMVLDDLHTERVDAFRAYVAARKAAAQPQK